MIKEDRLSIFLRFLLIGGSGFLIDTGITYLLISLGALPWIARVPAIAIAMTFSLMVNRKYTYKVNTKINVDESVRFFVVALLMAIINYLIYLVLINYGIYPSVAITIATASQMGLSFYTYRKYVFKKNNDKMDKIEKFNSIKIINKI